MSSPGPQRPPSRQERRLRWAGIAVGVLVPLLSLLVVLGVERVSGDAGPVGSVASAVWGLVALTGVLMLGSSRTRPVGAGILLGFSVLGLVGAGICTAVVMGGSA